MIELKGRRIVLIGGAGFIGSHLIDRLLVDNQKVVCLDNMNDFYDPGIKRLNQKAHLDFDHYAFVEGDIRDSGLVEKTVQSKMILKLWYIWQLWRVCVRPLKIHHCIPM